VADDHDIVRAAERVDHDLRVVGRVGLGIVARQVGRDDAVPGALQLGRDALPGPAAVPGAVDEGEDAQEPWWPPPEPWWPPAPW
jgi:hypothetical protein